MSKLFNGKNAAVRATTVLGSLTAWSADLRSTRAQEAETCITETLAMMMEGLATVGDTDYLEWADNISGCGWIKINSLSKLMLRDYNEMTMTSLKTLIFFQYRICRHLIILVILFFTSANPHSKTSTHQPKNVILINTMRIFPYSQTRAWHAHPKNLIPLVLVEPALQHFIQPPLSASQVVPSPKVQVKSSQVTHPSLF
jgi:hypothetical protein